MRVIIRDNIFLRDSFVWQGKHLITKHMLFFLLSCELPSFPLKPQGPFPTPQLRRAYKPLFTFLRMVFSSLIIFIIATLSSLLNLTSGHSEASFCCWLFFHVWIKLSSFYAHLGFFFFFFSFWKLYF